MRRSFGHARNLKQPVDYGSESRCNGLRRTNDKKSVEARKSRAISVCSYAYQFVN